MTNKNQPILCTQDLLQHLNHHKELWIFEDEIDPNLELGRVQRLVCQQKGPAVLFTNVKGTKFPVATNLYGSAKRLQLAFGDIPTNFIRDLADLVQNIMPPSLEKVWNAKHLGWQVLKVGLKNKKSGPLLSNTIAPPDLIALPQIKSWPEDGGAFVTLPLVYTESPINGKSNLGMYRIQFHNEKQTGVHIQIHRGGGFHYFEAEKLNQALPATVFIGGPPALTIAAIAPLPEDIPELLFASLLLGKKLDVKKHNDPGQKLILDADFAIVGSIPPHTRKPEGPFGDHYGYYSLCHDYPYMEVDKILHRDNAVFPATIVGRPPQEDHYITEFLQEVLEPLFPLVLQNVKKVWAYEESGVHSLAGAIVQNRYHKEAFTAALKILGEGQLSLTKFLMVTDQDCDIKDFRDLFIKVLERADFERDLFVLSNISQDTLDYTGPKVNEGSKAILLGLGEKRRDLKNSWRGDFSNNLFSEPTLFCPGALCIKGRPYNEYPDLAQELSKEASIQEFSMVFLLDNPKEACRSTSDFIWHVFTRFEPAADIYGKQEIKRLHIAFQGPLIIDCRMKPWYPDELEEDPDIVKAVDEKWGRKIEKICQSR